MDLLRAGSLVIVVLGHMLMAVVVWRGTSLRVDNLLEEIPELKLATWALQVMPVFFAAGAIANRMSITSATARGEPWRSWLWHRVRRFVRPVVFYVAIVIPLAYALAEIVPDAAGPLGKLSTQLLWFLGVYVLITAATPWEIRLARNGLPAIFALLIGVVVIDLARFHVWAGFGAVNFVLVWFMAATLGLIVRDRVDHDRRTLAFLALGALAVNIVLVVVTELPYPISMVGMPGERVSNMSPPTLVLALHSVVLVAVMGLAWPALRVLCATPRVAVGRHGRRRRDDHLPVAPDRARAPHRGRARARARPGRRRWGALLVGHAAAPGHRAPSHRDPGGVRRAVRAPAGPVARARRRAGGAGACHGRCSRASGRSSARAGSSSSRRQG